MPSSTTPHRPMPKKIWWSKHVYTWHQDTKSYQYEEKGIRYVLDAYLVKDATSDSPKYGCIVLPES